MRGAAEKPLCHEVQEVEMEAAVVGERVPSGWARTLLRAVWAGGLLSSSLIFGLITALILDWGLRSSAAVPLVFSASLFLAAVRYLAASCTAFWSYIKTGTPPGLLRHCVTLATVSASVSLAVLQFVNPPDPGIELPANVIYLSKSEAQEAPPPPALLVTFPPGAGRPGHWTRGTEPVDYHFVALSSLVEAAEECVEGERSPLIVIRGFASDEPFRNVTEADAAQVSRNLNRDLANARAATVERIAREVRENLGHGNGVRIAAVVPWHTFEEMAAARDGVLDVRGVRTADRHLLARSVLIELHDTGACANLRIVERGTDPTA